MRLKINGTIYQINKQVIEDSLEGIQPNTGGRYFVELDGTSYPIKQMVSLAIGIRAISISTNHAYAILSKIGYEITEGK